MRTDLLIVWPGDGDMRQARRTVIECKVLQANPDRSMRQGLEQTRAYMDRCAAEEGHLVLFDRRAGKSWKEKIFRREEAGGGARITVWGM